MDFDFSPKVQDLRKQVSQFMEDYVYPNEQTFEDQLNSGPDRWQIPPIIEELKEKSKAAGLWNLFLPESEYGYGLTNLEYAPLSEIMGRVHWGSEVFNCSAPDTGNMEVLSRYGTPEQQKGMAGAAARRQNSFLFCHDRTRGGLVRCHQYRIPHRARRG